MNFSISIYHDRRRRLQNGLYPVKVRVHSGLGHKTKFYQPFKNKVSLSEADFELMMDNKRIRGDLKNLRIKLETVVARFNESASRINPFNFKGFEREIKIDYGKGPEVFSIYDEIIENMKKRDQIGNISNYNTSISSFKSYLRTKKRRDRDEEVKLYFHEVTPEWLNNYEHWMTTVEGNSLSSVSIYTRTLRTVFNYAISMRIIDPESYPFGRRKYVVPNTPKVKKALTKEELEKLIQAEPENPFEEKSKDFFLLLFYLQGMNVCDLVNLKQQDYKEKNIIYYRTKVTSTKKGQLTPVIVYLQPQARAIIEKYRNKRSTRAGDYLIDHLYEDDSPNQKHTAKKNLVRYINQHLKSMAKRIGINPDISTNFARHTFATLIIKNGGGIELAKELLNHSSVRVTEGYFSGFADSDKSTFLAAIFNNIDSRQ